MSEPASVSAFLKAEQKINLYNIICNIELLALNKYSKYPYNLKDNVEFTQNQLTIHYKENYRKDKMKSKIGSNEHYSNIQVFEY